MGRDALPCNVLSENLRFSRLKASIVNNTTEQFDTVIKTCKSLFIKKTIDYGTAWRILRPESITDQIFIKAQRIRTLEEKKNIES